MKTKYPYKYWYSTFFNFWVIILLAVGIILLSNELIWGGLIILGIGALIIINIIYIRIPKYNQRILALRISENILERKEIEKYIKDYIISTLKYTYEYISNNEHWSEEIKEKYWPRRIPQGQFNIYELAKYWTEEDISTESKTNSELQFAFKTWDEANKFFSAMEEGEKYENDRIEKHINTLAKISGKNYWEVYDSVMEKEQKKTEEYEMNKEKKNRKKLEEDDRILGNSAKMIFTGVTGKCPFCLKTISMLAVKCPHCTADLRKM